MKGKHENPKQVEGKQTLFVVNLKAREIFGYTSHSMLFYIGYEDGIKTVFVMFEIEVSNSSRVG